MPVLRPVAFALLAASLPAFPQAPKARPEAVRPCDDCLPGVINFAKLDGSLWRGAQPTADGFKALEKAGVKTVVSFRHDHDDLPLMKGTQLRYLRIPSRAFQPREDHILAFLKVLEDPANHPVFIHCAQGRDRTGYNAAAYRIVMQGWSAEEALKEMHAFRFNRVWVLNPGFVRKMDAGTLKAKLKAIPAPTLTRADGGRSPLP